MSKTKTTQAELSTKEIFPFQWTCDDVIVDNAKADSKYPDYKGKIYIWGWNRENEGVCVRIDDFEIPMWIELPKKTLVKVEKTVKTIVDNVEVDKIEVSWTDSTDEISWTDLRLMAVEKYLQIIKQPYWDKQTKKLSTTNFSPYPMNEYMKPISVNQEDKQRLYGNEFVLNSRTNMYDSKPFPFFTVTFHSMKALENMFNILNTPHFIAGIGYVQLSCLCANRSLTPAMKLMTMRSLPSAGWIAFESFQVVQDKISTKNLEYRASWKSLKKHPNASEMPIVHPLVCSFDIETYSSDHAHFPDPTLDDDCILQIGCVFARKGKVLKKVCLTLQKPSFCLQTNPQDDFEIISCISEKSLLSTWAKVIQTENPDVLIGYNIFGFDIKYMHKRAEMKSTLDDFLKFGCIKGEKAKFTNISWESSARGKVEFQFLSAPGRLFIDLLPLVKAAENLENYKLEFVASKYLTNVNKDPIKPKDIFESWKEKDLVKFYKVAKYCVQDTYVTYLLFEKLLIWFGLVESATANKVPIFCMVSQGQQIKAFAQVFDYCYHNNLVCNPPFQKAMKTPYRGAIVTEPIAGLYKTILPFDFASLYPSIMIAHNIDFSRFVSDPSIPEECAPTLEWSDHQGCGCKFDPEGKKETKQRFRRKDNPDNLETPEFLIVAKAPKTLICKSYKYRFLTSESAGKGAIPSIITSLLLARKKVRKLIQENEELIAQTEDEEEINKLKEINQVLDKRQLAYKVNANSMYGMFGAENGYLPFFPGAECVTYIGRRSIEQASDRITNIHGGKVIYNDTDSAYCYFSKLEGKSVEEIWEFAMSVVKDIQTIFPAPMKLEFEEKIYSKFLIFGKKRYIAEMTSETGKVKDKLYMRGVPLVRREYISDFKEIYEACITLVLKHITIVTSGDQLLNHTSSKKKVLKSLEVDTSPMLGIKKTGFISCLSDESTKYVSDLGGNQIESSSLETSQELQVVSSFNKKTEIYWSVLTMIMQHFIDILSWNGTHTAYTSLNSSSSTLSSAASSYKDGDFYKKFIIYKGLSKAHEDYSEKTLVPAHVAVAKKIAARGTPVLANTRIEYVLLANTNNSFDKNEKQSKISESLDYFCEFRSILRLNTLHYINSQYVNNLDQLIFTIFGKEKTATKLFGHLIAKNKVMTQLKFVNFKKRETIKK